jgi:hypothetical protein
MKFRLPEECSTGIGIAGAWFPASFGVVDLPDAIVLDHAECIAAHGLTAEPETSAAADTKRRPRKD